ncbi:MAG: lipocalin family protein, partial [Methylococcales bacterium]
VRRKRKFAQKRAVLFVFSVLFTGLSAWFMHGATHLKPAEEWFEFRAPNQSRISLPLDDAAHRSKIEWWYYNGYLTSETGRRFSFHDTVFLVNNLVSGVVGHVSLNDHQAGLHYTDQHGSAGNPSVGLENRFEFKLGDWLMAGGNGKDRLKIVADDFGFDLRLTNTRPAVFHGEDGIISLAAYGGSYYYSRTRMDVSGILAMGGKPEKVTGISWFDHQWGDFSVGRLAWDWFSLQLDNDIDVMIYRLRDKSNKAVLDIASVRHNGKTEWLKANEFDIKPGRTWASKQTGSVYPATWTIEIPQVNMDITTRAIIDDCEFDARLTTYNYYWEGPVSVQGTHRGQGFMELSRLHRPIVISEEQSTAHNSTDHPDNL